MIAPIDLPMLRIYTLSNCDTCRKAVKWLQARGVAFEERAIRETPPGAAEVRAMLKAQGGELKKVFNVAGGEFREQKLGEKLPTMTEAQAVTLLSGNGSLVKRPFLIGEGVGLTGFKEAEWAEKLGKG